MRWNTQKSTIKTNFTVFIKNVQLSSLRTQFVKNTNCGTKVSSKLIIPQNMK